MFKILPIAAAAGLLAFGAQAFAQASLFSNYTPGAASVPVLPAGSPLELVSPLVLSSPNFSQTILANRANQNALVPGSNSGNWDMIDSNRTGVDAGQERHQIGRFERGQRAVVHRLVEMGVLTHRAMPGEMFDGGGHAGRTTSTALHEAGLGDQRQNPVEDRRVYLMRQARTGLREPRMIRHAISALQPQKLSHRQRIRAPPFKPALRADAFEIAHQMHAEIASWRHRRRPQLGSVIGFASRLGKAVEPILDQH